MPPPDEEVPANVNATEAHVVLCIIQADSSVGIYVHVLSFRKGRAGLEREETKTNKNKLCSCPARIGFGRLHWIDVEGAEASCR